MHVFLQSVRAWGAILLIPLVLGHAPRHVVVEWMLVPVEQKRSPTADQPHDIAVAGHPSSLWKNLGSQAGPLLLIVVVVILRSVTGLGFGTFLAELGRERGLSLIAGGVPLGIYNIAGVVGGLTSGYLADRIDPKPLVWGSLILAAPALYAFVYAQGWVSYLLLMIGGGLLLSSNSILVAMAQELAPENSGLVSSLPLGFSWGVASLSLPLIGYSADQFGMAITLKYLALLPLLTALLAFFLPAGMIRKSAKPSRQKS